MDKLLVANRGEIARRIMRTCRAMGIATVAVHSDPDADAPFVREADEAVRLPGASPSETYLDVVAVVDAAVRTGADAVHPGYGFLSENAAFAEACERAGLVFVGPPPAVIRAMGSKLEAKARMADAGVPVLPGADVTGLAPDALAKTADELSYPLLVKASAGGGGRGMRVVRDPAGLHDAVAAASREAASAFGDDTVFLERYVEAPRHVEIQIFGDTHGEVVHLFERECSIQRRHQKLIEEAPSVAVDDALRAAMGRAAVAAGRAIGYVGAGTVEFVLEDGGRFWFLEVNTRLQVEHPVTEVLTGLDLVRAQIVVAGGGRLPADVREARMTGHAIEARLYAEDPEAGFAPSVGTLARFAVPGGNGVRVDAGAEDGSQVSIHYDAMLAKVVAHAPTRAEAIAKLVRALRGARIHGVTTNRDLLAGILAHPEFAAGRTDTHFLERHNPASLCAADPAVERVHAIAASQAARAARTMSSPLPPGLRSAWRNNPSRAQTVAYETRAGTVEVAYTLGRAGIELDGAVLVSATPEEVVLETNGVRRRYEVHLAAPFAWVDSPLGSSMLREAERFPGAEGPAAAGSLAAPMPGIVLRVLAEPGSRVRAGDALVVIEAMKTEHTIAAPHDGVVQDVLVAPGQQIGAGETLAVVDGEGA